MDKAQKTNDLQRQLVDEHDQLRKAELTKLITHLHELVDDFSIGGPVIVRVYSSNLLQRAVAVAARPRFDIPDMISFSDQMAGYQGRHHFVKAIYFAMPCDTIVLWCSGGNFWMTMWFEHQFMRSTCSGF
eukprot:gnl/MRDRNA2_/MRDRNA2_78979_c1_seq1.p1 gnl/MRDRNA2_/MRDRNA2_78979_c1~~gnl/MRDRNA2_/MRDRNA2_78979_c1_seq1.p1  ORF type:complete len:130 (-),score=19.17 gnl/MRDRNA2_/MRDRNA2_78979_c1_seq1:34-423(-)